MRIVVLISGSGSNLQALLDAFPGDVVAVVSNKADAYGLKRAEAAGVKTHLVTGRDDTALADLVESEAPDLVVLAGWLRLLKMPFLGRFPGKVINLHPAVDARFAGLHAIERAFAAWEAGEISETGVMVHYVPDEGVDDGPVILSERVAFHPAEPFEAFKARMHKVEHRLLVDAVRLLGGTNA